MRSPRLEFEKKKVFRRWGKPWPGHGLMSIPAAAFYHNGAELQQLRVLTGALTLAEHRERRRVGFPLKSRSIRLAERGADRLRQLARHKGLHQQRFDPGRVRLLRV